MRDGIASTAWERANFFRLIWLFPAVFVAHMLEERPGFSRWVTEVLGGRMDVRSFDVNHAVYMTLLLGLCAAAARTRATWALWLLLLWTTGQYFWDTVVHVYTQVVFGAYSPGIFTAVFGYLPVWCYLTYLVLRERLLPRWSLPVALVAGALGIALMIKAVLYDFGEVPWCRWAPFACG
jgi:hypothetical protein